MSKQTIVAVFDTLPDAEAAVRDLVDHGYDRSKVSLVSNDTMEDYTPYLGENKDDHSVDEGAKIGSGVGAILGGLGGVLVGLGALAIPGIGPLLVAGPMAAVLGGLIGAGTGALAGGALGALADALADVGVPEEEARLYAENVRRGGTLLVIEAAPMDENEIQDILSRHRVVDIHDRRDDWEEQGWTGFEPDASPYTKSMIEQERARYHRDTPYTPENLEHFDDLRPDFERHYETTYLDTGHGFERYRPAYYYGYQIAHYDRYSGWEWEDLEPEASQNWDRRADLEGAWEDFKEAVQFGWVRTREELQDIFN